ncbi:MAG: ABC transporter ATP-binding protein [Pseudomonadota bacterium]
MSALSVQNLSHVYGPKRALNDISFELEKGQFCALLGPNGAGKSTLFSLLARLIATQNGRVSVAGHDLKQAPLKALACMGIVFQQPTLDLEASVWRNMTYFAALHGLRGREAANRINGALDRLNMRNRSSEKVRALNGGHRRRMEIARALIHNPQVILLDEPTVGLDAQSRTAITQHVHDLAAEGITVLWATHLVDEIVPGDRVIILHHGEILRDCNVAEITQDCSLQEAFLRLTAAPEAAA